MFKYLFLFVMGLYILQSCFACNGNSTESPANCTETSTAKGRTLKRSPLSTDCGYYPVKEPELPTSIVGSERGQENSTEIPITPKDAWSFIRNSPSYKRTYTCLRSTNVSEDDYDKVPRGKKADVPFLIEKAPLNHMTTAKLTFQVNNIVTNSTEDASTDDIYKEYERSLYVVGSILNSPVINRYIPWLNRGPSPFELNFNPADLLRKMLTAKEVVRRNANVTESEDDQEDDKFCTVIFTVRRECGNASDACPNIFNTSIHTPSLRIFYM